MHPGAATSLFDNCAYSLQDVLRRAERHELQSFPLNLSLSFSGEFIERDFTAKNVIGIIRGTEVAEEQSALLISAHYDHLGVGPVVLGDSIYNGLIDNAAGVAAALEIGRNLAINQNKFRRSVILLFTTGEEKGLLGARYYTDHPLIPLHQTIANINIDGLAMFDTFYDVVGIGAELSNLQIFLENALNKLSFKYVSTPQIIEDSESFSRSDQFAFANGGIPSMLIMEGFQWKHYNPDQAIRKFQSWMDHIYHSPFDDINQPINFYAALSHVQIILSTAEYILQHDETPIWKPSVKFHNIRLQTIAERK
jgi:Zn-dependent M28 family amino/carboxypeptidase